MTLKKQKLAIFVASPGDVETERDLVSAVVADARGNRTSDAVDLEVVRWETHAWPGFGADAQDVVNRQVPNPDIFVGILWKRFGTPTNRAQSGTEEEFALALESWKRSQRPQIWFYFSRQPYRITTVDELSQIERVLQFREKLVRRALIWEYDNPKHFAKLFGHHLSLILKKSEPRAEYERSPAAFSRFRENIGDHKRLLHDLSVHERGDQKPIGLIFLDIDNLSTRNAREGLTSGDATISALSERLRSVVRGRANVYRVSGDEFAVLLPNTTTEESSATAERIRLEIQRLPFNGVSVTCGYCSSDSFRSVGQLYGAAREAMIVGKLKGKNVCIKAPLDDAGSRVLDLARPADFDYS